MAEKKQKKSAPENKKKNLHEGHRQKFRERFLETGLRGFSKHNILEFILFYSIPRMDTNETAHRLLDEFGSLKGVFDAPVDALCNVEGIGLHSAIHLKLIHGLIRAYFDEDASKLKYIFSTEDIVNFLSPKFIGLTREAIYLVCLDANCKILKHSFLGQGGISSIDVDIRSIASDILACNATSVIVAHNHPGGVCAPSKEDKEATLRLKQFLSSIDVQLIDHIIFAGNDHFSFRNNPKFSYTVSAVPRFRSDNETELKYDNSSETEDEEIL